MPSARSEARGGFPRTRPYSSAVPFLSAAFCLRRVHGRSGTGLATIARERK